MAKYCRTSLWQIYLCTVIFSWPCFGEIDSNNPTCADNEFGYISPNGQLTCKPCRNLPKCPSGLGVSVACGRIAHIHVDCVHCVLGKNFSAEYDHLPCQTCQSALCHENEKIIGSCTVVKDTSKCSGTCKKAFYSSDGDLKNCQPCSLCLNNASARVKKCKDDGLPIENQCEVGSVVPPAFQSKKQLQASKKNGATETHDKKDGYKIYGHPALLTFFLLVIFVLAAVVLRRKFRKKRQSPVVALAEVATPTLAEVATPTLAEVATQTNNADGAVGETVQPAVATVRKRKSSASSGERKVFFGRQISSNSNNGLDFSGEGPGDAQTPAAVNELSAENVFEGKTLERKQTPSSSSGKIGRIFSRQNSAQKKGTTDETTSLLSTDYNDNVFLPEVAALPAETSSSTAPHRLSGLKIGDLNAGTHQQLCRKLNLDIPNDWRTLAGDMKYNYEQVQEFAQDANPAKKLLDCWGTGEGHDVASLIKLVKGINRNDLVELLES